VGLLAVLAAALALAACSTTHAPVVAKGGTAARPVPVEAAEASSIGATEARLRLALAASAAIIERDGAALRVRFPAHSAFVMDQSGLLPAFTAALDELAHVLHGQKQLAVAVNVYTDAVGSESYNLQFSQARAQAIASYLAGHGIAEQRIAARGAGEAEPLVVDNSPEGRDLNRRVEFLIRALSS
jgi:outer membrane protein OmpA-like peptidoglycan-associated protein